MATDACSLDDLLPEERRRLMAELIVQLLGEGEHPDLHTAEGSDSIAQGEDQRPSQDNGRPAEEPPKRSESTSNNMSHHRCVCEDGVVTS